MELKNLIELKKREKGIVRKILGGLNMKHRLLALGITQDVEIEVIENLQAGPIIIKVAEQRNPYAIGRGMASRIFVEYKKKMKRKEWRNEEKNWQNFKIYQRLGKGLVVEWKKKITKREKEGILKKLIEQYRPVFIAERTGKVKGIFRKPGLNILYGNPVVIHKEFGILYKLDASKIMFSKGNLRERQRLLGEVKNDEIILDAFAGIGYFTLPLAKKVKKVYAVELNKIAYQYLSENIKLNKLKNIVAINKDCRKVKLKEKVNRILLGFLPDSIPYLLSLLPHLKEEGWLHIHTLTKKDISGIKKSGNRIKRIIEKGGWQVKLMKARKVKSWSPSLMHVVFDVLVKKAKF